MDRRKFLRTVAAGAAALQVPALHAAVAKKTEDESIKDYLYRIRNPDMHHRGDVVTDGTVKTTLARVNQRLYKVR